MSLRGHDSARDWVTSAFTWIEDIVYVGLGVLLSGCAVTLLVSGGMDFWQQLTAATLAGNIVQLLDRLLLILLIIEVLYTVQVSFREHTLSPEPFLLVGLIAVVRRLLVLMAELPKMLEKSDQVTFRQVSIELGLLSVMIITLVSSLALLRRRPAGGGAEVAVRTR